MLLRPRPEIENLRVFPHGGINYAELAALGVNPDTVLDFSVCVNPFLPSPVIRNSNISRYPDPEATELRKRLAEKLQVSLDNILVGSGTTELIRIVALTYFQPGDTVMVIEPTYSDYEVACRIVGAEMVKPRGRAENNFVPDIAATTTLIRQHRPGGVFLGNPNNPTGKYLSRREIETLLAASADAVFILDEAYLNFVADSWLSLDLVRRGNVIILRSMTKDYALAGLRLGYAVASVEVIDFMRRVCPPWNVNTVAQQAGIAVLENPDYLEPSRKKIGQAKQFLVNGLCRLGFAVVPSDAHFFLVKVGNAREFRTALLKYGILVRDCASFGLPEYVRIAPRTLPECRRLIAAVRALRTEASQ